MSNKHKNRSRRMLALSAASVAAAIAAAGPATAAAPNPAPFCAGETFTVSKAEPQIVPDDDATGLSQTVTVTGRGGTIRDLDLVTRVAHSFNRDVEMTLSHTPPGGATTTIPLIAYRPTGRTGSQAFNGTRWDDSAALAVTEADFTQASQVVSELVPEGAMAAFIGETPNGDWTLTVKDREAGDATNLQSWDLDFATSTTAPSTTTQSVAGAGGSLPDTHAAGEKVEATVNVSGAGTYLTDLDLSTFIEHTSFPPELQVRLTSPAGTKVLIAAGRGSGSLASLTTRWDDSASVFVADPALTWAPGQTRPSMVPDAALGAFIGENPNGTWTLEVVDTADLDGFQLTGWTLDLTTGTACPQPPAPPAPAPPATPTPTPPAAPAPPKQPDGPSSPAKFTLSAKQLLINQRIGQAAIRRLARVEAAIEGRPAPTFPSGGAAGKVTLSANQLLINQRIYQAGVRRAAILEARLDGRPAPTFGSRSGGTVRLTLAQLVVNQRIAQAAVRRANALLERVA